MHLSIISLETGWVELEIEVDSFLRKLTFSYTPVDALSDLVKATLDVVDERNAEVELYCGSEKSVIYFESLEMGKCKLNIDDIDLYTVKIGLARAILRMFDRYAYEYSIEAYERAWRHHWPERYLELLRARLKTMKT